MLHLTSPRPVLAAALLLPQGPMKHPKANVKTEQVYYSVLDCGVHETIPYAGGLIPFWNAFCPENIPSPAEAHATGLTYVSL